MPGCPDETAQRVILQRLDGLLVEQPCITVSAVHCGEGFSIVLDLALGLEFDDRWSIV